MKTISTEQALVLEQFLAEYWSLFEGHCEEHGVDANEIAMALGGEPE